MPVEWTDVSSTSCNLNEKKFKYHMISQVKTKSVWVSSQLFINIHRFGVFQYPTLVWHNARFSWKNVAHILIKSIFIHVFISELVLSNILVNWRRLLLLQSSRNFGIYTDFDLECRITLCNVRTISCSIIHNIFPIQLLCNIYSPKKCFDYGI